MDRQLLTNVAQVQALPRTYPLTSGARSQRERALCLHQQQRHTPIPRLHQNFCNVEPLPIMLRRNLQNDATVLEQATIPCLDRSKYLNLPLQVSTLSHTVTWPLGANNCNKMLADLTVVARPRKSQGTRQIVFKLCPNCGLWQCQGQEAWASNTMISRRHKTVQAPG